MSESDLQPAQSLLPSDEPAPIRGPGLDLVLPYQVMRQLAAGKRAAIAIDAYALLAPPSFMREVVPGRLDLFDAKDHLLGFLLDVPRDMLMAARGPQGLLVMEFGEMGPIRAIDLQMRA